MSNTISKRLSQKTLEDIMLYGSASVRVLPESDYQELLALLEAYKSMLETNQKTIAVMGHCLLDLGVNFDFAKVEERWAALKNAQEAE